MKKGIIGLLLAAVMVIIVSPGIIGKLAEEGVDENLRVAATGANGLNITSAGFDRSWFSSEGQHRIELTRGDLRDLLEIAVAGIGEHSPALIINTRLDHGLIPVSSLGREHGSLTPGLGSAVSTLTLELGDDETVDIPGSIYSKIGLTGDLHASYLLPAGSHATDDETLRWESGQLDFSSDPATGNIVIDGQIGNVVIVSEGKELSFDGFTFSADQRQTQYGFAVGDVELIVGGVSIIADGSPAAGMRGLNLVVKSEEVDGIVSGDTQLALDGQQIPFFGEVSVTTDVVFSGVDATALAEISARIEGLQGEADPTRLLADAQDDIKRLFAGGFNLDFKQLDIDLPMGTVVTTMNFDIPRSDAADFEWTTLLLDLVASVDIELPSELVDMATQMYPEANMIIGMGYLTKEDDVYTMEARLKRGLMTINGAPSPLPLGAFR